MPRDANGNTVPLPGTIVSSGDTILPSQHNPMVNDVYAMMTQSLSRDGQGGMRSNLNMNGYTINNLGASSLPSSPALRSEMEEVRAEMRRFNPPGRVMMLRGKQVLPGWIREDGRTIGNAGSGATNRANADTQDLYVHLWNNFDNTELPIQSNTGADTTRGTTAIADFNAGKRLPLFDGQLAYARSQGTGLTVGQRMADEIRGHTHTGTTAVGGSHRHNFLRANTSGTDPRNGYVYQGSLPSFVVGNDVLDGGEHSHTFTTNSTGGSETRPLTSVYLFLISL